MLIFKRTNFYFFCLFFPVLSSGHLYVQPSDDYRTFFTGEEFFISCVVDNDGETDLRVSWRTPSGEITDNEGRIHVESEVRKGEKVLNLFVNGIQLDDKGDYACVADRDGEEESHTINIEVYRAITFTGTPLEQISSEGSESATVLCNVIADPDPRVTWIYNKSTVHSGGRYKISKGGLTIVNVSRYDAGVYICRAMVITEKNSLVKSQKIKFLVQYAPYFSETEFDVNSDLEADFQSKGAVFAPPSASAILVCKAEGFPAPTYKWYRNKEKIIDEITSDNSNSSFEIINYHNRSVLNVSDIEESLLGEYVCRVENNLGWVEKTFTLKEGHPPTRPSVSLKHSDNHAAYFQLSFGKHGGRQKSHRKNPLRVTGYLLQFRPSMGPGNGLSSVDWDSADQLEFKEGDELIIGNLTSVTGYVVRVAARNAAGFGQFSPEIRFNMVSKDLNSHVVSDQEAVPVDGEINGGNNSADTEIFYKFLLMAPISQLLWPICSWLTR